MTSRCSLHQGWPHPGTSTRTTHTPQEAPGHTLEERLHPSRPQRQKVQLHTDSPGPVGPLPAQPASCGISVPYRRPKNCTAGREALSSGPEPSAELLRRPLRAALDGDEELHHPPTLLHLMLLW